MRILLTNDDGINAPGLSVLEDIAKELSDDIWIAAPEEEQSGKGRAISLTQPVRTRKVGAKAWAIAGTPSDCVLLAMQDRRGHQLFRHHRGGHVRHAAGHPVDCPQSGAELS